MLLEAIRDERSLKTEYTKEDAIFFLRLSDYSTSYKKLKEYLANEKMEFVNFLKDFTYTNYNIEALYKRFNLSYADKDKINRYEAICRYIKESSSEFQKRTERINNCYNSLLGQLGQFETKYIAKAKELAEKEWNRKVVEKTTTKSLDEYINLEVDSAQRYYVFSLMNLAERLINNGVNEENIKVQFIGEDMKLFEMILTDGKKTFHGRAIIAAEFSSIVSTHVRFIITKSKK